MNIQKGIGWIGIVVIASIIAVVFLFFSYRKTHMPIAPTNENVLGESGIQDIKLFSEGLAAVGIDAEQIGFHSFSADGKYFLFNAFKNGTGPANQGYLLSLTTGAIKKLPGMPERGLDDSRIVQLYTTEGTTLYWLATGEYKTYKLGENIFYGSLSPDGKTYIVNTLEGIKKIDIATGAITTVAKNQYDGAYAWFSDNVRILGFQQTDENLLEAGKGRVLGIWNITDSTFTSLDIPLTQKTIRSATWIVPNKIARVNTGWDDGSFDYIVDVESKKIISLGDTSGALMGGVKVDVKRQYLGVLGGDPQSSIGARAVLYKGMEKRQEVTTLSAQYFRENLHIVDETHFLYIRKHMKNDGGIDTNELVLLDLKTGEESVIRELPNTYVALSLASDYNTWVASADDQFFFGTIK